MVTEADILTKLELLQQEIATLTEEVLTLKREHRADLDDLRLELETLTRLAAGERAGFLERFTETRHLVEREISPE